MVQVMPQTISALNNINYYLIEVKPLTTTEPKRKGIHLFIC